MRGTILICRPQPGADATAAKAGDFGMQAHIYPLFAPVALQWNPPAAADFDAVLLTSANTARLAGDAIRLYTHLPAYAIGEESAKAARSAGFGHVTAIGPDASATAEHIAAHGHSRVFHPGGKHIRPFKAHGLQIEHAATYEMKAAGDAKGLIRALQGVDAVLVHSPRAGERLDLLVPTELRRALLIVAISTATQNACGAGWRDILNVPKPDDKAMLAMAQQICNKVGMPPSVPGPEGQE